MMMPRKKARPKKSIKATTKPPVYTTVRTVTEAMIVPVMAASTHGAHLGSKHRGSDA